MYPKPAAQANSRVASANTTYPPSSLQTAARTLATPKKRGIDYDHFQSDDPPSRSPQMARITRSVSRALCAVHCNPAYS